MAAPKLKKATVVNLIDGKRGQNAGIALARIKMTYSELRNRIQSFNASGLSTDQLRSLDVSGYKFSSPVYLYLKYFFIYGILEFISIGIFTERGR